MNDLISVIIPCFKQGHYLPEVIASLQSQTHTHWEAIVVNDGSPDDTAEISAALQRTEKRVRYLEKPNGGLSSARNAGLDAAHGDWIQFLDADDLLEPSKFATQLAQLKGLAPPAFSYSSYWHGVEDNPRVRAPAVKLPDTFKLARPVLDIVLRWEWEMSIPIHTALFDAQLFRDHGVRFDETLPNHEDWDMWMQVLRHAPSIAHAPEELAIYRNSATSMSRNTIAMQHGYLLANHKQSQVYRSDTVVLKCLRHARKLIKYHYKITWWARSHRALERNQLYRKFCPWPIQQLLSSKSQWPEMPEQLLKLVGHQTSVQSRFIGE